MKYSKGWICKRWAAKSDDATIILLYSLNFNFILLSLTIWGWKGNCILFTNTDLCQLLGYCLSALNLPFYTSVTPWLWPCKLHFSFLSYILDRFCQQGTLEEVWKVEREEEGLLPVFVASHPRNDPSLLFSHQLILELPKLASLHPSEASAAAESPLLRSISSGLCGTTSLGYQQKLGCIPSLEDWLSAP